MFKKIMSVLLTLTFLFCLAITPETVVLGDELHEAPDVTEPALEDVAAPAEIEIPTDVIAEEEENTVELRSEMQAVIDDMDDNGTTCLYLWLQYDIDFDAIEQQVYEQTGLKEGLITDDITMEEYKVYKTIRRSLHREAHEAQNGAFVNRITEKYPETKVLYQGMYTPVVIISTTKANAEKILAEEQIASAENYPVDGEVAN